MLPSGMFHSIYHYLQVYFYFHLKLVFTVSFCVAQAITANLLFLGVGEKNPWCWRKKFSSLSKGS